MEHLGAKIEAGARIRMLANSSEDLLVWYPRDHRLDGLHSNYDDPLGGSFYSPIYRYFNVQDLLAQFFLGVHFDRGRVENWRTMCIGISSYLYGGGQPGNHHLPMLDYDGKNVRKTIRKDVQRLQKDYGLNNAWVYETRRGFHVYFFCDTLPFGEYCEALDHTGACDGFKQVTKAVGSSVLRISAKYTDFDIKPLYVLKAPKPSCKRMLHKAHLIQAILALGEECGTHFASLYPQWARFREDQKEWRLAPQGKGKRIRRIKLKPEPKLVFQAKVEPKFYPEPEPYPGGWKANDGFAPKHMNLWQGTSTYTTYATDVTTSTAANDSVSWITKIDDLTDF